MIIIRYLVREIFKSQTIILFILLLIFLCRKLISILDNVIDGEIPISLVFTMLILGMPKITQIVLPLSLFLAILITLGKLYVENEIIAMYSCGFSQIDLIKSTMILMLMTMVVSSINIIWIGPWSARYQNEMKQHAKINPNIAALTVGRFQQSSDGKNVLFIENMNANQFGHVFLAHLHPDNNSYSSIVVANSGSVEQRQDGSKIVILDKGTRFEGTALLSDFRITNFSNYRARIGYKTTFIDFHNADQASFTKLMHNTSPEFRSELHWRLMLIFSVLVMTLIAVPLSITNPKKGHILSMLPAILLYFIFFFLQTLLKSNGEKDYLNPAVWIWTVNLSYLILSILLNLWNTVSIRYLRVHFIRVGF